MSIDRAALASFLRRKRATLQPAAVGLATGVRRRTKGLRREEVALLSHMSTDYYTRLEQERGPQPSPQMLSAIAHGLLLSLDERDHLFRLAGHAPPERRQTDYVGAGMMRIFMRLQDTPVEIVTDLGETLKQTPLSVALVGDLTRYRGVERSLGYRWFAMPEVRALYPPEDHERLSRMWVSGLREVSARRGASSRAAEIAEELRQISDEFRTLWEIHEVGVGPQEVKRFVHPEVGELSLQCQALADPATGHMLLVYTAADERATEQLALLAALAPASAVSASTT